jgi:hypothetical protein
MRNESRARFDEQSLKFRVLRAGNECFVHGVDYCLVIGDFVIDVSLVKGARLTCSASAVA